MMFSTCLSHWYCCPVFPFWLDIHALNTKIQNETHVKEEIKNINFLIN